MAKWMKKQEKEYNFDAKIYYLIDKIANENLKKRDASGGFQKMPLQLAIASDIICREDCTLNEIYNG